jgi:hypothetical protein
MDNPEDDEARLADINARLARGARITAEERQVLLRHFQREQDGPPLTLDDPDLPAPARVALEAVAALDSMVPELEAWHHRVLERSSPSERPAVPEVVVAWFRRSFAATMAVIDVSFDSWARCSHPNPTLSAANTYEVIYMAASATPEYERDDDLRLLLPDVLFKLLSDHGLAVTLRCHRCRERIRDEISADCRAHYKSQFRAR